VALEGNLKDFSLGDVFRLLYGGKKTGALHVTSPVGEGAVYFDAGRIYFATASSELEPASKRLAKSGLISEKQLRQAQGLMKIQKKDKAGRKLGQILVDEGYLESHVIEQWMREQISDALFDMLRWNEGDVRFDADERNEPGDIGIGIAPELALESATKRLEAWNKILEKIPSMDTYFAIAPTPGMRSDEIHLKPREWMMLCYLHNGRSVQELVGLTGYSDFEAARVLYGMYTAGLVEKVGPSGEPLGD